MEYISHLVLAYGYLLIFALVFLDQSAVSIPSPPFVTAMGVLASSGRFNICVAFPVVFAAAFVADCLWFRIGLYVIGHSGRAGSRHRNTRSPNISNFIKRGLLGAILSVKFSLLPSAVVPFAAGSSRLGACRFVYMAALGNLAWTAAYLMGGFTAGYAIMDVLARRNVLIITSLASCLFLLALFGVQWGLGHRRRHTSRRM